MQPDSLGLQGLRLLAVRQVGHYFLEILIWHLWAALCSYCHPVLLRWTPAGAMGTPAEEFV